MIDGARLHMGKRFVFQHNDMASFDKQLENAAKLTKETGGGIMVMTEGVFGMAGDQGKLKEIVERKAKYNFRLFVDDAHGFGQMGESGRGTADHQGVQKDVDIYFGTFAKAMASIGGFISGPEDVMMYMRYNMRSQTFAKSLPMPIVIGALKRLEMMRTMPELNTKLWDITNALQTGLKDAGLDIGETNSCVTPVYMKGGVPEATNVVVDLRENHGIFCSIVVYPVIPKDMILLRLIPTAAHSMEDVKRTIDCFKLVKDKLLSGAYKSEKIVSM
jgi:glycine C-acetyltransferase